MIDERSLGELSRGEALQLMASVPVGRLVFTHQALPAIRPVNHLVDGDKIVIGLTAGSAIAASSRAGGTVVAYEADSLDLAERSGWTVIVVGLARIEADVDAVLSYQARLRPWLSGATTDVLTISSEIVTGYRLMPTLPADEIARTAE
ncbi:MAG TPA: pyridoxamine 5'-phosphate oxidase family protein [Streptosporangiaceae bacterium]|nr:pyridoxamine 5'-phosphate oxidase family protein [Streptosporangiaceae bacterium]